MSRSYRKPYGTFVGSGADFSSKQDKVEASRAARRKQNSYLQNFHPDKFEDDFLIPHRYECRHNDVWGWKRDGKQSLRLPRARDWSEHYRYTQGYFTSRWEELFVARHPELLVWPPYWYVHFTRK